MAYSLVPDAEPGVPPPGYPSSKVTFRIINRIITGLKNCDVISFRTCQDIEGKFCDFIELQYQKKVLLTGPMLPELGKTIALENQWNHWLRGFEPGSVVFLCTRQPNQYRDGSIPRTLPWNGTNRLTVSCSGKATKRGKEDSRSFTRRV
uniref:Uncharacterized protein n=1 Tax=Brassica campestris TaxID=3711 RepID=A0A3P6A4N1_BRACM|nr:unnamed protein product [Brassica rapa]